jgi:hypothetical protein
MVVAHRADGGLVEQDDRLRLVPWAAGRASIGVRMNNALTAFGLPVGALDRPREGRQDDNLRCATLPAFMNNRKTTKRAVATSDLDPATLAKVNVLKRQRQRMNRTLLKRRRQKSGQ